MTTQKYVTEREKNHCCPQLKLPELKKLRCKINNIPQFVSSARSSSVHHGLLHTYIQTSFPTISNLEQSCLYTFIYNFHFHSVFNIWNRTSQYFGMNDIDNARMHVHISSRFYKVLQISLRPKMCYIF